MFEDRDLAVLGVGAVAAVACLLLPLSFAGKLAAGAATLFLSVVIALLRLGGDRIPIEEWIRRRIRFSLRPRRWTYRQKRMPPRRGTGAGPRRPGAPKSVDDDEPRPRPFAFTLEGAGPERLAGLLLAVAGVYFLAWLAEDGARTLAVDLQVFLP